MGLSTPTQAKIKFLRQYGPIPRNDNMYDETIVRSAKRTGVLSLAFEHPQRAAIMKCFTSGAPTSVILTGTAGDGKTHLCRQVWHSLGGAPSEWESNRPYLQLLFSRGTERATLHIIRDLSAWVPQVGMGWEPAKQTLLHDFCRTIFTGDTSQVFLIAANDGQLIESWRRLPDASYVRQTRTLLEQLLVDDQQARPDARLEFFNLSRGSSAALFEVALEAFLSHEVWSECQQTDAADDEAFGSNCPIRYNYELLQSPLVRQRLRTLFQLCDYNDLHVPIRQILLLLTNAVLGHPDVKDRLMVPSDVPALIRRRTVSKASLYNNVFGGNLSDSRRESIAIFGYFDRFRIGHETSNRIENILIYGDADSNLRPYYERFLGADRFYGADEGYRVAQRRYVERVESDALDVEQFLQQLVSQRRSLFFKIPPEDERDLHLWDLTVFKYAGEYVSRVVDALGAHKPIDMPIKARLVKGLNRVFSGMLINTDHDLILASSLSVSSAKVNRILEETVSVSPRLGEKVEIVLRDGLPVLNVVLAPGNEHPLVLHLTRYEFLSRVAEGALPNSFSKECYEDILAFKSRILGGLAVRREQELPEESTVFHLLVLDEHGNPHGRRVELAEQVL